MSTDLYTIGNTGRDHRDLDISQFYGGPENGIMLQLTQGFAGTPMSSSSDEPGFIQLKVNDAKVLVRELNNWIKQQEKELE